MQSKVMTEQEFLEMIGLAPKKKAIDPMVAQALQLIGEAINEGIMPRYQPHISMAAIILGDALTHYQAIATGPEFEVFEADPVDGFNVWALTLANMVRHSFTIARQRRGEDHEADLRSKVNRMLTEDISVEEIMKKEHNEQEEQTS